MVRSGWLWLGLGVTLALAVPTRGPAADDPPADGAAAAVAQHDMTGVACSHCHDSPHGEQTDDGCATCHATEAWSPSTLTVADHAGFAFPLEGKHADVSCGLCHTKGALTGLPTVCNECHLDRHRGILGDDCTECHSVEGFAPVEGFDHTARTGFALTGFHGAVACEGCHDGDNGRALRVTREPGCETCHSQGHGPLGGACVDCHTTELATWADARATFDHAVTGFPLERRHTAQPCVACHPTDGIRPTPRCTSCHDDVHSGQLSVVCSDCHRADRWRLARFDHDRAGWTLRGRHFVTPCLDCHTNQQWMGLRSECWDCHAVDARRGPTSIPAHVGGLSDCSDCHSQWSWR